MYDMHYDLLTILYYNLKSNSKSNQDKLINLLIKLYCSKIKGGIINLYFMNEEEMFEELGITKEETNDVITMFRTSIEYLEKYKRCGLISTNIDYIYGIEGCDYLDNIDDLETLYKLGLRAIIPVWNNQNKFGSGAKTNKGLTNLGIKLIEKAIELGIIIDVSHANEKTFYDIINVIEKSNHKNINLIASHSNVRTLCDRDRNLTDEQLIALKEHNGYIGLFTNGNFVSINNKNIDYNERVKNFLKHLKYIIEVIQFDTKKIMISTDDMNYHPEPKYHNLETYPLSQIYQKLYIEIYNQYGEIIANDILINNSKELIMKVK